MIIEISVGVIAIAFVLLVVFLVITLQRLRKVMKKTERVLSEAHALLHGLTEPVVELIDNTNRLTIDVKKKLEGLDVLFRPLYVLKKTDGHHSMGKFGDIAGFVVEGIQLFNKIKNEMK